MEISVQARHHETVRPEIGRLHASARAEASDQNEVLRKATEAVQSLQDEFARLRDSGAVVEVVVCAIDRSPAGQNPLADVGLEVRPVLTKAQLDAVRG